MHVNVCCLLSDSRDDGSISVDAAAVVRDSCRRSSMDINEQHVPQLRIPCQTIRNNKYVRLDQQIFECLTTGSSIYQS